MKRDFLKHLGFHQTKSPLTMSNNQLPAVVQDIKWEAKEWGDESYAITDGNIAIVTADACDDGYLLAIVDLLNGSGYRFHSENKLELDLHIDAQTYKAESSQWEGRARELEEELKAKQSGAVWVKASGFKELPKGIVFYKYAGGDYSSSGSGVFKGDKFDPNNLCEFILKAEWDDLLILDESGTAANELQQLAIDRQTKGDRLVSLLQGANVEGADEAIMDWLEKKEDDGTMHDTRPGFPLL